MGTPLRYIEVNDLANPGATKQIATVYSRYKKLVEDLFPVDKFAIIMEPVQADLLMSNPTNGTGGMSVKVVSLETGTVIRNAFATRLTDPSFDIYGVSKVQTDALRNLLKLCGFGDEFGLDDEEISGTEVCKDSPVSEDKVRRIKVIKMPEPSDKTIVPEKKKREVPEYRKPSRAQKNLVSNLSKGLGIQMDSLKECQDQEEIKFLIKALRSAQKNHHKGDDFGDIISPFLTLQDGS